jgi:hypothetical protein
MSRTEVHDVFPTYCGAFDRRDGVALPDWRRTPSASDRLRWDAHGQTPTACTWQHEVTGTGGANAAPDAIPIALPSP